MGQKLDLEQIYHFCNPASLKCETSEDAPELDTIIGQDRAVRSLHFGLDIKEKGFNMIQKISQEAKELEIKFIHDKTQRRLEHN